MKLIKVHSIEKVKHEYHIIAEVKVGWWFFGHRTIQQFRGFGTIWRTYPQGQDLMLNPIEGVLDRYVRQYEWSLEYPAKPGDHRDLMNKHPDLFG